MIFIEKNHVTLLNKTLSQAYILNMQMEERIESKEEREALDDRQDMEGKGGKEWICMAMNLGMGAAYLVICQTFNITEIIGSGRELWQFE